MRVALFGAPGKVGSAARAGAARARGTRSVDGRTAGRMAATSRSTSRDPTRWRRTSAACSPRASPSWWGRADSMLLRWTRRPARRRRAVLLRPELRARRSVDDALRRGGGAGVPARRDRRAARRDEARRALRHRAGDGARMGTDPAIHSVRLPGLVAHQEVIFGGPERRSRSGTTRPRARPSSRACCWRSSGCATSRRA